MSIIQTKDVKKWFGDFQALKGITMDVAEGEVLVVCGPSGSGKELIARKIHKKSKRNTKPFVILNGALLDANKYELELFGEEKENGSISYGALEKAFSSAPYEIEPFSFSSPNNSNSYLFASSNAPFKITKGLVFLFDFL